MLGAGGVVGGAFHAGVLAGIAEATGWDPLTASVVAGTSASSVVAAGLTAGLSAADMLARAEERPMSAEGVRLLKDVAAEPLSGRAATRAGTPALTFRGGQGTATSRPKAAVGQASRHPRLLVPEGRIDTEFISTNIATFLVEPWPDDALWICAVRKRDLELAPQTRQLLARTR